MSARWSGPGFERIAELVRERTGLIFPDARVRDIEAIIRRTIARGKFRDENALLTLLHEDEREREAFVAELTIGESYFQRDPAQFEVLRRRILPELLSAHPDRALRIWSAGCASGEEPYTIAMLFEEIGAAARSDIVGTDIARTRLEEAQRGIFSKWQLRGMSESVRSQYFTERGRYFELSPRIRRRVDFRYLNLAEDSFPSLSTGIWGMDVILCRNVLIYFDAETVERVARRLVASLSDDGWLLLGGSDPHIAELIECDVVLTDAGLAYRRKGVGDVDIRERPTIATDRHHNSDGGSAAPGTDPTWSGEAVETRARAELQPLDGADMTASGVGMQVDPDTEVLDAYARRDFARVHRAAEAAAARGALGPDAATAWVRALANEGRIREASAALTSVLEATPATPELLYLHAVLLLQSGRAPDAAAAARRALYLDSGLVVAHLTLAEAERHAGRITAERRALRNAAALLEAMPPEAVVAASDGESAGRLAELVRVKLSLLRNEE